MFFSRSHDINLNFIFYVIYNFIYIENWSYIYSRSFSFKYQYLIQCNTIIVIHVIL